MDSVKNIVLNKEARRQLNSSSPRSDVFITESRGRSSNKDPKKDKNKIRSKYNKFSNNECYFCHKKWHMKNDCWKLKNKQQGNQEENVDQVTVTEDQFPFFLRVMPLMSHAKTPVG